MKKKTSYILHHKLLQFTGIVPFVATPLKGRFVVFTHKLMIGYFRLDDCPEGLGLPAGARNRGKSYCENTTKRPLRGVAMKGTIPQFTNKLKDFY